MRWKAFRNIGFSLGYLYFDVDVDVDVEDSDWLGFARYKYHGPHLSLSGFF